MKRDFDERQANVSLACQTNRMILKCQKCDSAYHISCQMKSINYGFGNRLTNRLGTTAMIKRAPGLNQQNADTHVEGLCHGKGSPFSTLEGDIPTKWSTLLLVCMHIVCSLLAVESGVQDRTRLQTNCLSGNTTWNMSLN